jgi:hypothetical protein
MQTIEKKLANSNVVIGLEGIGYQYGCVIGFFDDGVQSLEFGVVDFLIVTLGIVVGKVDGRSAPLSWMSSPNSRVSASGKVSSGPNHWPE